MHRAGYQPNKFRYTCEHENKHVLSVCGVCVCVCVCVYVYEARSQYCE